MYLRTFGFLFLHFTVDFKVLLESRIEFDKVLDLGILPDIQVDFDEFGQGSSDAPSDFSMFDFAIESAFCSKVFHLYAYIKPASEQDIEKSELQDESLVVSDFNKFDRGEVTEPALDLTVVSILGFTSL